LIFLNQQHASFTSIIDVSYFEDKEEEVGLSKRNGVTFLTYYFPIISRILGARKFIQAPFDAARHAVFML
jgi:hypothetical protein